MAGEPESVRMNIGKVIAAEKERYIDALKNSKRFVLKSFLPIAENCHFERYSFVHNQGKLSIVYDTKAEIFSLTARSTVLAFALSEANIHPQDSVVQVQRSGDAESDAAPLPEQDQKGTQEKKPQEGIVVKGTAKTKAKKSERQAKSAKNEHSQGKLKPQPKQQKNEQPQAKSQKTPSQAKPQKATDAAVAPQEPPEYKNGFSIKKCTPQRMEGIIKRIQALKKCTVHIDASTDDLTTYTITDKSRQQKCLLRYMPKKQSAQLQGKRSNLFGEVQVILSSDSGFTEAVESHMELTDSQMRMSAVQRSLKKLLPDAFEFLSEQSKIDLGIGMIDIGNDEVRLSDYSVLLVPPYRGLERFIFDLQQAKGISVKMIGQAYEKDENGTHVLKLCYRRKTGVVYSEVMSALYTEYFERRNFYAHSDNTDMGYSRMIAEKSSAKSIFDKLCEVINYNSKKLKEIGFSIPKDK